MFIMNKKAWTFFIFVSFGWFGVLIGGCSDVFIEKPSNEQALIAVREMLDQGVNVFIQSPIKISSALISKTKVHGCKSAEPQEGIVCGVTVSTQEVPLFGGFSTEINLRFVSHQSGWVSYLQ